MYRSTKSAWPLSLLAMTLAIAVPAASQTKIDSGSYLILDVPGAQTTRALGVNKNGQIVGDYLDANFRSHAFLRENNGAYTTLIHPEYPPYQVDGTSAAAINNAGQIVGQASAGGIVHSFLQNGDGSSSAIEVPGASQTVANGINAVGDIVGYYYISSDDLVRGFLRDAQGSYTTLVYRGVTANTYAFGINKSRQIVGEVSFVSQNFTGGFMLDSGGNYTVLSFGIATGVDDVGNVLYSQEGTAVVATKNGSFTILTVPGSVETHASGISSLDQIVGYYLDSTSASYRGFLRR